VNYTKVAFTSDFGYRDHYVAVVKATILGLIAKQVEFIDVSHDVGRQDVRRAAYVAAVSGKYLGEDTVHLVVVDPTVGTDRRIVVYTPRGHCVYVAPDNGVLTLAYQWFGGQAYYARTPAKPASRTFHARDVFAPIVAQIVEGGVEAVVDREAAGDAVKLDYPPYERLGDGAKGCVLYVDVFGDVITNIPNGALGATRYTLTIGGSTYIVRGAPNYSAGKPGELLLIEGSEGYYEVSVNRGSAASTIHAAEGSEVKLVAAD
jgi:S-adenosylmethionine hydrolase